MVTHTRSPWHAAGAVLCVGLLLMPRVAYGDAPARTGTTAEEKDSSFKSPNGLLNMGQLRLSPTILQVGDREYLAFDPKDADLIAEVMTVRLPKLVDSLASADKVIKALETERAIDRQIKANLTTQLQKSDEARLVLADTNAKLVETHQELVESSGSTILEGASIVILGVTIVATFAFGVYIGHSLK